MMWDNMSQELFTQQYTKTFSQIFPSYEAFEADKTLIGLPETLQEPGFLKTIYILLMGEYASSSIMNMSESQFRIRFWSRVMSYGGQYERELKMQQKLLNMSDDELQVSSKVIYNSAFNPSTEPSTDTMYELPTINQQNTTNHKRSLLDAYSFLEELLDDNITKKFVRRFNDLFVVNCYNIGNQLYYKTMEGDNE